MRVSDQRDPLALCLQAVRRLADREHVFPDRVARARVVEAHAGLLSERREWPQVLARVFVDHLDRPARGGTCAHREVPDVDVAANDQVVVARQAPLHDLPYERGAGIRVGAVSDDVAQAPNLVGVVPAHVGEHRLERGEIAVDVGDDGYAQGDQILTYPSAGGQYPAMGSVARR